MQSKYILLMGLFSKDSGKIAAVTSIQFSKNLYFVSINFFFTLLDVTGKIFLADFDKSREITDDTKYSVISKDLQVNNYLYLSPIFYILQNIKYNYNLQRTKKCKIGSGLYRGFFSIKT